MCTATRHTCDVYTGLWNRLAQLAKKNIRGLYRGMVPALFGTFHGVIQFMAYEEMKKWRNDALKRRREPPEDEHNAKLSNFECLLMVASPKVRSYSHNLSLSNITKLFTRSTHTRWI